MKTTLALLALLSLAVAGSAAAQLEEEDIGFQEPAAEPQELMRRFEEASAVFASVDQPDSIALFTELIDLLEPPGAADPATREDLLTRSLFHRAEARFNLGMTAEARTDLRRALEVVPDLEVDFGEISPKLADLFRSVRDETVGRLAPTLDPPDAVLLVDGAPRRLREGTVDVLAGTHAVTVERPGYDPFQAEIEVAAGQRVPVTATLERTSAALKVMTRLPGAEVVVDGEPRGVTVAVEPVSIGVEAGVELAGETEDEAPAPGAASAPAVLTVDGLMPGDHVLEIRREGYRPYRGEVGIVDLVDYELAPIELIATRGTLTLASIPPAARVTVDGAEPEAAIEDGGLSVDLPVGRHEVVVEAGTVGSWSISLDLEDQEVVDLVVELAPRVAVLGILGGDSAAASRLLDELRGTLGESGRWVVEDRSADAPAALAALGIDAVRLRGESPEGVEWLRAQELADRQFPASVYVLAVLSDDLFASSANLYLWSAAPGPARAEELLVQLGPPIELDAVRAAFEYTPAWRRPRLGGRWLLSPVDGRPVVVDVFGDGPFAAAGLQPGDRIVSLEGRAPEALDALPAGSQTPCVVARGDTEVPTVLRPVDGPSIFAAESESVPAAVLSAWVTLGEALDRPPAWQVALNRAALAVRLDDWEGVVLALRGVEAPLGPGLGRAMVDYWLGTALLATDPAGYLTQARSMLERAAAVDGGRLFHDDGPEVAPRALARLGALESR